MTSTLLVFGGSAPEPDLGLARQMRNFEGARNPKIEMTRASALLPKHQMSVPRSSSDVFIAMQGFRAKKQEGLADGCRE